MGRLFLEKLRPHPCFGGLDLAAVNDLTAFVLAWQLGALVYAYPWFFLPGDGLAERSKRDNVPYEAWSKAGYIELTPGSVTDWRYVTDRIKQLAKLFKIRQIAFDRYGARDTVADLMEAGLEVADTGQGFVSMNAPSKGLQELVLSRRLIHTGHPVLRWNDHARAQDGRRFLHLPHRRSRGGPRGGEPDGARYRGGAQRGGEKQRQGAG